MNLILKRILLGLIIWVVPFVTSVIVWDTELEGPRIPMEWFTALMAVTWAIGFMIAALLHYRVEGGPSEGWITGITWYLELVLIDLAVLVGAFGMPLSEFYPLVLTYSNTLILSIVLGYVTE